MIQTLNGCDAVFTDAVVDMLMLRFARYEAVCPENLAYTIARNWAMSQKRRLVMAEKRVTEEMVLRAECELRETRLRMARQEFNQLLAKLWVDQTDTVHNALLYMQFICVDGISDAECAPLFPDTNRAQRYQWLQRARKLMLPLASEALRDVLAQGMWQKKEVADEQAPVPA